MTLPLETAAIDDQYARRACDVVAQQFPIAPPNALGAIPTTTATLPTGTYNGQDFYYQLGSGGGVWHFKYNTSSGKWDFSGGPPLISAVDTAETTASATYTALATAGPSIALPFAGDYQVEIGAYMRTDTLNASAFMSYDIGGTGAVDADGMQADTKAANDGEMNYWSRSKTGLTAVTLTVKYRTSAGTARFAKRVIRVCPIRVG